MRHRTDLLAGVGLWALFVAALLAASSCSPPAHALPPANNALRLQPTEIRNWSCDYGVAVSSLVSSTVTVVGGTDASASTLINTPTVSGTTAAFTITAVGKASGTIYQLDIVVADALGQRFACNGKVTVQTVKVTVP